MTDDMTLDELAAIQRRHDNSLRSPTVPGDLETAQRTERILRDDRAKLLALLTATMRERDELNGLRAMWESRAKSALEAKLKVMDRLEAAESQLSRLKERGWQAMDTAPRDGTEIIYRAKDPRTVDHKARPIKNPYWVGSMVWRDADEGVPEGWWDDAMSDEITHAIGWIPMPPKEQKL